MSWEDQSKRGGDDDLMGVHGDVLFADPLGIRKDKAAVQQPAAAASRSGALREPRSGPGRAQDGSRDDDLDMNLSEHRRAEINRTALLEESPSEDPGPLRNWFGYIFGGGTQCCGNRDRNKDAEMAKKASMTGRPPATPLPAPGIRAAGGAAPSSELTNGRHRGNDPAPVEEFSRNAPPRGAPPAPGEDPFATRQAPKPGGSGLEDLHNFASSTDPPLALQPDRLQQSERTIQTGDLRGAPSPNSAAALEREKPPEGHLPRKWQWPQWTLNTKEALIEVYVTDEDSNDSRWCQAQPQFRVVDKDGNDAYLCAEYEWDGEYYVQDFGPHHVRKRGQDMTVFELFSLDPSATNNKDFMQETMNKSMGRQNMQDTDPFGTSRQAERAKPQVDSGGGVGAWLND